MKKISFLFFTFHFLLLTLNAQPVTQEWVRRYNYPDNLSDAPTDMVIDTLGNVYVTGEVLTVSESNNYCTIKYNSAGVQQWVAFYNGPSNGIDIACCIATDRLGNVYVTGYSNRAGPGSEDYCTIKYSPNGVKLWVARYNGTGIGSHLPRGIAVDDLGNVYVTGGSGVGSYTYYLTIKYNTNGDSLWTRSYIGPFNYRAEANAICVDSDRNVYVTGYSYDYPSSYDVVTIKYNTNGDILWLTRSYYTGVDAGGAITIDKNGNVYVTGTIYTAATNEDYLTIKYNSFGSEQWNRRYNGPTSSVDVAFSIAVDSTENVYVTGFSSNQPNYHDIITIKYNTYGDSVWTRRYDGPDHLDDNTYSIALDKYANVYLTGNRQTSTGYEFVNIKYNTYGVLQWLEHYPGGGRKILVDKLLNVYVTGTNSEAGTGQDFITIKYSQLSGIQPVSNKLPNLFKLEQNFPNPFNPSTRIRFSVPQKSFVQLRIFDMLGRLKDLPVNEYVNPSEYELRIDASNYSSGTYFYQLIADGNIIETKKMILIK